MEDLSLIQGDARFVMPDGSKFDYEKEYDVWTGYHVNRGQEGEEFDVDWDYTSRPRSFALAEKQDFTQGNMTQWIADGVREGNQEVVDAVDEGFESVTDQAAENYHRRGRYDEIAFLQTTMKDATPWG